MSPDVKIDSAQIKDVLMNEVIKREVMEGDKADEAKKKIAKSANKALRASSMKSAKQVTQEVASKEDGGN